MSGPPPALLGTLGLQLLPAPQSLGRQYQGMSSDPPLGGGVQPADWKKVMAGPPCWLVWGNPGGWVGPAAGLDPAAAQGRKRANNHNPAGLQFPAKF